VIVPASERMGELNEPTQPVGTSEKACDVVGRPLGSIVPWYLKTHGSKSVTGTRDH
jgi:hypothetical protein